MDTTAPVYYTKQGATKVNDQEWATPPADRNGFALYYVIRPFLICLRLIGGFPYTVRNGVLQVRLCSWWTFYSVAVMSLQILFLILTTHHIYVKNNNNFDNKVFSVINIMITFSQVCGPLTLWYEVPSVVKYLSKWYDYQEELRLCGIVLDTKLRKWITAFMLISIPYVSAASYYQSMVHGGLIHMPAVVLLHFNTFLCLSVWYFCVFFLQCTSYRLIQRLRHIGLTRDSAEIAACRKTWLTLADLTAELGDVLGPTLMEILLLASALVIINCYFLMFIFRGAIVVEGDEKNGVTTGRIFFVITMSIMVIFLCDFGHRCTKAVGVDLLQELLRINSSSQEKEFQREVNMFIQTVSMRYPDMVLCGFLTLNRRLLVSRKPSSFKGSFGFPGGIFLKRLVSSGITYLIVLLQFRSSEDG